MQPDNLSESCRLRYAICGFALWMKSFGPRDVCVGTGEDRGLPGDHELEAVALTQPLQMAHPLGVSLRQGGGGLGAGGNLLLAHLRHRPLALEGRRDLVAAE